MVFVPQNPKVKPQRFEKLKMKSHNFNEFTVLYNSYGKKQFMYLSLLLGSPSMTQDHFILKILFVGRFLGTDPNKN